MLGGYINWVSSLLHRGCLFILPAADPGKKILCPRYQKLGNTVLIWSSNRKSMESIMSAWAKKKEEQRSRDISCQHHQSIMGRTSTAYLCTVTSLDCARKHDNKRCYLKVQCSHITCATSNAFLIYVIYCWFKECFWLTCTWYWDVSCIMILELEYFFLCSVKKGGKEETRLSIFGIIRVNVNL